jgi:LEA14-like dessication related protein
MKRNLLLAAFLTAACVALSVCVITLTGCNSLANLHLINPTYSLRSVSPRVNLGIPPSVDLDFTVNVNNPNPVELHLDYFDFDVLINNNPVLRNVHSVQGFRIPPQGDSDVHLATHVTYDSMRNIYDEVVGIIQGNRASYGIQGNAYYDTPVGQMRFPVNVYSSR